MTEARTIHLTVNGRAVNASVEPRMLLSDFIRDVLKLTGTHVGCEHGICGTCTVLLDNQAVRSCLMFAVQADGRVIETVEGLSERGAIKPLQEAFSKHHALQCGFCTPGMLVVAYDLLSSHPNASDAELKDGMSAAICRCTGYLGIMNAVRDVAAAGSLRGAAEPEKGSAT